MCVEESELDGTLCKRNPFDPLFFLSFFRRREMVMSKWYIIRSTVSFLCVVVLLIRYAHVDGIGCREDRHGM